MIAVILRILVGCLAIIAGCLYAICAGCVYCLSCLWPYLSAAAGWLWSILVCILDAVGDLIFYDNGAFLIAFVIIIFILGGLSWAMSGEEGSGYGYILSVIGCGYGIWRYFPETAKWLWSCLAWIFDVEGGGLGWIFDVVSGGLSWIFNVVSGGLSWIFNGVLGSVSWISNSLNFGAIYGSLGVNSEFFPWIFIVAIVAFIFCYNANKQNKWSCRCLCYIPVILSVAAPIVGNYANVPIFGITPVGVSTLGANVVASHVILLIWLLATALVLVAGMYIEKQRNELQAKIKAVDSALEKLRMGL